MNESLTRKHLIDPILTERGWRDDFIYPEFAITDGQIIVQKNQSKRKPPKRADYLLTLDNSITPLAVIEAKHQHKTISDGMQQAINYAVMLDCPFAYATNGHGFMEHDRLTGKERQLGMHEFPTPDELYQRYISEQSLTPAQIDALAQPYHYKQGNYQPRYYQRIAIDRTLSAIARGDNRILLVMATGTGKTYTAFQIIWRLKQAGLKKNVLYLADRNILIDQTISKDFKPFEGIITKIQGKQLQSEYEIHMGLYHQLVGDDGTETYRQFTPDFFDLIVVDECHRGSAKENSRWRKVLDYFSKATHLGLTATPKETKEISNLTYFGEPVYTYSLKQGIQDGFLAPYSVVRVITDKEQWQPPQGQTDIDGNLIEERIYNNKDYDRNIILTERDKLVARRISTWLKQHDRYAKTIVFCVDIDHAERLRHALVNENSDLIRQDHRYIMRITGDNTIGKGELDNFIDPNEPYPTIVTTSKLLTTGVDCKTCKLIVLDTNIQSMTEFKQIIGRGTRVDEAHQKTHFTIMDFRGATRLFEDKEFDGEPVVIIETPIDTGDDTDSDTGNGTQNGTDNGTPPTDPEPPTPPKKVIVGGVSVEIEKEIVKIYTQDGKLTTQSIKDFTVQNIHNQYATLDHFIQAWFGADKKQAIINALDEQGVFLDVLEQLTGRADLDPFDLIAHIAYDTPPLTRAERANNVKKRGVLHQYSDTCQQVLDKLLQKYKDEGLLSLENSEILKTSDFNEFGSPMQIVRAFGGKEAYFGAIRLIQNALYQEK